MNKIYDVTLDNGLVINVAAMVCRMNSETPGMLEINGAILIFRGANVKAIEIALGEKK